MRELPFLGRRVARSLVRAWFVSFPEIFDAFVQEDKVAAVR